MTTKEKIIAALKEAGIHEDKNDYIHDRHKLGLPDSHVMLLPEKKFEQSGLTCLCISSTHVFLCHLSVPYNHNNWNTVKTESYNSPEELITTVNDMYYEKKGCWSSNPEHNEIRKSIRIILHEWLPDLFKDVAMVEISIQLFTNVVVNARDLTMDDAHVEYIRGVTELTLYTMGLPSDALKDVTELLCMGEKFQDMYPH